MGMGSSSKEYCQIVCHSKGRIISYVQTREHNLSLPSAKRTYARRVFKLGLNIVVSFIEGLLGLLADLYRNMLTTSEGVLRQIKK